jgi:uncharacterized protein with FMN-binding domain
MSEEEKAQVQQGEAPEAPTPAADVAKRYKPRKWPIVIAILAICATVFFVAFLHMHEEPWFCNSFCHQPMDRYVEGYYSEDISLGAAVHENAGVTCLGCHWKQAKMLDLVHEVVSWSTDSFTDPLPDHSQEVDGEASFVSDEFCGSCHDGTTAPTKESATAGVYVDENGVEYDPHNIPSDVSWHQTAGSDGGEITCGDCHTVHKASTMVCAECHSDVFNSETVPDGWVIPEDGKALTSTMGIYDPHSVVGTDTFASLSDMHTTMGENGEITCTDCHKTDGSNVFICAECHADQYTDDQIQQLVDDGWTVPADYTTVNDETMGAYDPHDLISTEAFQNVEFHQTAGADGGMITCTDCHQADGTNVFICAECHASDYEGMIPDGWTVPESTVDVSMMGTTTDSSDSASTDESTSSDESASSDESSSTSTVDLSTVPDGTYHGEAQGLESTISVDVTVSDGKITDVQASGNETEGIGSVALEEVPAAIVEAGTTEGVDGHAGATVTSNAIFEAVNNALASATE